MNGEKLFVHVAIKPTEFGYELEVVDENAEWMLPPHITRAKAAVDELIKRPGFDLQDGEERIFAVDVTDEPISPEDSQQAFIEAGADDND